MLKHAALCLASALALSLAAAGQTTNVTASNLKMGGAKILAGTVTATPVNAAGNAIPFADATGSQNGPTAFACQITAGAITGMIQPDGTVSGTCALPDSVLTTPANLQYTFQVSDTTSGRTTSGRSYTLPSVVGVTGTTWALDRYAPPAITSSSQAIQQSQGPTTPTSCAAPSVFTNTTSSTFFTCVAGVEVQVGGGGGGGTVTYGTSAGTAAQGNDARITGAEQVINKGQPNGYLGLDSTGHVPAGFAAAITAGDTSRTAGATSETVVGIQGKPVSATAPTTGQTLVFNGTTYTPTTPASGTGSGTVNSGTAGQVAVYSTSGAAVSGVGTLPSAVLPVFVGSGASHAIGAVPDPGATAGTTRYLREDGTFAAPGTVTTVGAGALGLLFTSSVANATTTPALTFTPTTGIAQNAVLAGPASGGAGAYSFRSLVTADLPAFTGDMSNCVYQLLMLEGTGTTLNNTCPNGGLGTSTVSGGAGVAWNGLFVGFYSTISLPAASAINLARSYTFAGMFPVLKQPGVQVGDMPNYTYSSSDGFGANNSFFCGSTLTNMLCEIPNSQNGSQWANSRVGSSMSFYGHPTGGVTPTLTRPIQPGYRVITFQCGTSADSTYDQVYVDGVLYPFDSQTRICSTTNPTGYYQIGSSPVVTGGYWPGEVGFFQADTTYRTSAQIASLHSSVLALMANKGARFTTPRLGGSDGRLVCGGDSRTNGYQSSQLCGLVQAAGAIPGITNYYNMGINGALAEEMARSYPWWTHYYVNQRTVVSLWTGYNEATGTYDGTEIANIKRYADQVHADGALLICSTEISATGRETALQAETVDIRLNGRRQAGCDNIVDYAETTLGVTGANTGANFNADHVHPNTSGTTVLAGYLNKVVAETLGSTEFSPNIYTGTTYTETPADGYAGLGATATANSAWTLLSCVGFTRPRYIYNRNATYSMTVAPASGETFSNGSSTAVTIAANSSARFFPTPNAIGTAGCTWDQR